MDNPPDYHFDLSLTNSIYDPRIRLANGICKLLFKNFHAEPHDQKPWEDLLLKTRPLMELLDESLVDIRESINNHITLFAYAKLSGAEDHYYWAKDKCQKACPLYYKTRTELFLEGEFNLLKEKLSSFAEPGEISHKEWVTQALKSRLSNPHLYISPEMVLWFQKNILK